MHFAPIENPPNAVVRLAYWLSKRRFAKVPTPLKVLYARRPALLGPARAIARAMDSLSLDPELKHLLAAYVSKLNGCAFCADLAQATAMREKVGAARFAALDDIGDSDVFNARERAALKFMEALTREKGAPDKLAEEVHHYYTDHEILDMVWLNAATNYYNLLALPLGIGSDNLSEAVAMRDEREDPASA